MTIDPNESTALGLSTVFEGAYYRQDSRTPLDGWSRLELKSAHTASTSLRHLRDSVWELAVWVVTVVEVSRMTLS